MRRILNGQVIDIPASYSGSVNVDDVRSAGAIPANRALILKRPGGKNELLRSGQVVNLDPDAEFMDAPLVKRGGFIGNLLGWETNAGVLEKHLAQLADIYTVDIYDSDDAIIVRGFKLPPGWNHRSCSVKLEIPSSYPESPPGVGSYRIYVPSELRFHGSTPSDFHEGYSDEQGKWAWWCYQYIVWDPLVDSFVTLLERLRADMREPL